MKQHCCEECVGGRMERVDGCAVLLRGVRCCCEECSASEELGGGDRRNARTPGCERLLLDSAMS